MPLFVATKPIRAFFTSIGSQMPKIPLQLVSQGEGRTYLNTKDESTVNCYVEKDNNEIFIVKRPGFNKVLTMSAAYNSLEPRSLIYVQSFDAYFMLIGTSLLEFSYDFTAFAPVDLAKFAISSITYAAPDVTVTTTIANNLVVGQLINISGVTETGYSGQQTVKAILAANQFTYTPILAPSVTPGTGATKLVETVLISTGKAYFEITNDAGDESVMLHIPSYQTTASTGTVSTSYLYKISRVAGVTVVTAVVDADRPSTCVGLGVAMDGYYFLAAGGETYSATGNSIHNCDLETPLTWNGLGYVSATTVHGKCVSLCKSKNHIVVMKDTSLEFFYDAVVAAPASPLLPIPQQTIKIGCASAETITQIGDSIYFVSRDTNSGFAVHVLNGASLTKISNNLADKVLAAAEGAAFQKLFTATSLTLESHQFYLINIAGTINRTIVYDIGTGMWSEWSTNNGSGTQVKFFSDIIISGPAVSSTVVYINSLAVDRATGDIYELSPPPVGSANSTTYKDGSQLIKVKIVTKSMNGGTGNKKRGNSLEIFGDRHTATSTLSIRVTKDDYKTWSTARTVDLQNRAIIHNLGMFQIAAFELTHEADTPLRLKYVELDADQMGH